MQESLRSEAQERVDELRWDLARIASGTDVAYHTSGALCRLQGFFSKPGPPQITPHQRDDLLQALITARPAILALFPVATDQALARKGIDAAVGLVCTLAESDDERASRHRHVLSDLRAYARWLRNACHNLSLLEEIESRASERRAEAVAEILRSAAA